MATQLVSSLETIQQTLARGRSHPRTKYRVTLSDGQRFDGIRDAMLEAQKERQGENVLCFRREASTAQHALVVITLDKIQQLELCGTYTW